MKANEYQIGGTHYKREVQPWDYIARWHIDYFAGDAIVYILRHREKNKKQDLEKACHYCVKLIEVYEDPEIRFRPTGYVGASDVKKICTMYSMTEHEHNAISALSRWENKFDLLAAIDAIKLSIKAIYGA